MSLHKQYCVRKSAGIFEFVRLSKQGSALYKWRGVSFVLSENVLFMLVVKRGLTSEEALKVFFSLPGGSESGESSDSGRDFAVPSTSGLVPEESSGSDERTMHCSRNKQGRRT